MTSEDELNAPKQVSPKVVIAHDYLTQRGGAEKVVLALTRAFPSAPIHTLLYDPEGTYPEFEGKQIITSPLNRLGWLRRNHRVGLPLYAFAASLMTIDADVVVVSSSGWAHGYRTKGRKLVYCYSPARWLYMTDLYLGDSAGVVRRMAIKALRGPLTLWDRRAAASCAEYLAISSAVQERINVAYRRPSMVLPAPVEPPAAIETNDHIPPGSPEPPFFLCISRLLAYKNVDAVIEAFRGMPHRLVVVGRGPELGRLHALKPSNVTMLSDLSNSQMDWLYRNCLAVVAASYEDYGLTPLEGGMRGKPCAVLRFGGFLDTVDEGKTGLFFDEPVPEKIRESVMALASRDWDSNAIKNHVDSFSEVSFIDKIRVVVGQALGSRLDELDERDGQ